MVDNLALLAAEINVALWRAHRSASYPAPIIDWLSTEEVQTLLWLTDDQPDVEILMESWALKAKAGDQLIVGIEGAALFAGSAMQAGVTLTQIDIDTLPF